MDEPSLPDVTVDVRADAGGKDPDSHSRVLQRLNGAVYSRPLPDGTSFALEPLGHKGGLGLIHESERGRFVLSSDTIANSNRGRARIRPFYEQMPEQINAAFHNGGVAARVLFPAGKVAGKRTINGARGMHPQIADRFDLTLECIRRFYENDLDTPLGEVLARYREFFDLFETFDQYVQFFYLDDLVEDGAVKFYIPFAQFGRPLPTTFDAYKEFRSAQVAFVSARRERMRAVLSAGRGSAGVVTSRL